MPSYLYSQNVSARDRFTQIELQLDNGKVATLRQGNAYDLTATEVARARSFVTMVPSGSAPAPSGVAYLPIRGDLSDGDVPVWDSSIGAFVPGAGGGSGGGNQVMVWNSTTSQYEAAPSAREFRGPNNPATEPGITMGFADTWEPTDVP
jgi:hypothetical protein